MNFPNTPTGLMHRAAVTCVLAGICALTACQTAPPNFAAYEDGLAAAGFVRKLADTPQRQAMLARLPPNQFLIRQNGDVIHYVYADPILCGCLYVGTQQAYDQFRANQQQQNIANEQQTAAQMYQDAAWSWDTWGPWGPVTSGFGFVYGASGW